MIDVDEALATVDEATPLVNAITNNVTVRDVANVILEWGALPVMSDDRRDAVEMVAGAQGLLLNTGDVSEDGVETMVATGESANDHGVPVVVDPVGAGATSVRSETAARLLSDLDVAVVKANRGEIAALAGAEGAVRGVESVGDHADAGDHAAALARETGAAVVASGAADVVATPDGDVYEVDAGHPAMGEAVGTGCMLGGTCAAFAGAIEDRGEAAVAASLAFGLAGEAAAEWDYRGPGSYLVNLHDAVAGLEPPSGAADRVAPHGGD
ncbi:MAG: hydroxyethylthiazole kinase [Haloferacaceae archaeon]